MSVGLEPRMPTQIALVHFRCDRRLKEFANLPFETGLPIIVKGTGVKSSLG